MQPQSFVLFGIELKREVGGESFLVTRDLLVKPLDGDAIELRKINVENYSLMTKNQDARFDCEDWRSTAFRHPEQGCVLLFFHLRVTVCDLKIIVLSAGQFSSVTAQIIVRFPIWSIRLLLFDGEDCLQEGTEMRANAIGFPKCGCDVAFAM